MIAVIWIDWYSYHICRLKALFDHDSFRREVIGIELVGGCGVHRGMRFRSEERKGLPISNLFPESDWQAVGSMTLARAVWRGLNAIKPSAVLVPGWYTIPGLSAALWAKLHAKRCVVMTETTEMDYERVWWKELIKRLILPRLFDLAIAGGKPQIRYLARLGFGRHRIGECYDVVDNAFYQEYSDRLNRQPDMRNSLGLPAHYFLFVGRLSQEKNVATLVRAFARYRQWGGTWSLLLVGDGPERETLETLAVNLGLSEHVMFKGLRNTNEVASYLAYAESFVLPSICEPWGLVVNEAMACGLPVLVSNRCGCAEDLVEPGRNGYLFEPTNEGQLASYMWALQVAPDRRDAMGKRSREIVAGFSPGRWAAEVARLVQLKEEVS